MLKHNYDSNNHIPTATAYSSVIFSLSINFCITDDRNQNISTDTKRLPELHFLFGHCNICATQIIIWSPPFVTNKFLSYSCIPVEQNTKY